MAVLLILLIAGAATVAVYLNRVNGIDARDGSRQAAISAARTAITDLTTADYRNPQQYMDRLKPLAAGQFLNMFTNSAAGFKDILAQGKVQTTGRVVAVGVQHFHGDTAQLSVLAYETVSNSQTPKGSERAYRMSVSMILSGSRWLVSNVEFVQ
jgi:Mce-associated membrane protein